MTINEAHKILHTRLSTFNAVAEYLGMTRDHYRCLRNGKAAMPKRTAEYIILKAEQLCRQDSTNATR